MSQQYLDTAKFLYNAEKEKKEIKKITSDKHPDLTIEDAYDIQRQLIELKEADGHKIVGPKMGLTSEAKLKQMNVENPIYAYVIDYMLLHHGITFQMDELIKPKAEFETVFILKQDLEGPGITTVQVLEETEWVFPAIEIIDSTY